ncbi:ShlB/FhaC/HecB family hemolysin secretion/activation protein [Vibrio sp. La 4.2.2]|uniref:ShlB/FhaC/HecB family hemolysin secretion/activation protein n=1 Tax=Vibrio sp. La 4.2.2 TaxID=2998830 RepID=UPI0022CE121F|nr:ShlB/FhaC/HecB family hemolysin secretion/activation protein [Vibrio sp. La 4.2.2]MDA0107927.1 ShlB/FhaC/HecB family hemolysin secretion/activation protein [Vibrio sp. La 4.2.2]
MRLALLGCLWLSVGSAWANDLTSPATQSDIEQAQAERLQRIEQAKDSALTLTPIPTLPPNDAAKSGVCFELHTIVWSGNTVFDDEKLLDVSGFTPSCLNLGEMNALLRRVSNHYLEAGYVTSRAYLVPQDLTSGVLEVVIVEGRLEALLMNGQPELFLRHAFPNAVGQVLNLRDIEQGLDQINRLSRYNAQIELLPGQTQGHTIVNIQTREGRAVNASLGFNNGGQPSTGETQLSASVRADNLLDWLEQWSLSGNKSSAFASSFDSENLTLSLGVPFGYWSANFRTSYSRYYREFTHQHYLFDSSGQTNTHTFNLRWLALRDSVSKTSLNLGLTHRREKNYLLGSLLEGNSRNLSGVSLTADHSQRVGRSFWTLSPSLGLGVDWFGGEDDGQKALHEPKAQYIKGSLTGSVTYLLPTQGSLTSTLFGQWTHDELYGTERLSIGGEYSVRGFKGASLSGDQGFYWRNEAEWPLGSAPYFGQFSARMALDAGHIVDDARDALEGGTLAGMGVSLRTHHRYFQSQLMFAAPLYYPERLKADDYVAYYQLTVLL